MQDMNTSPAEARQKIVDTIYSKIEEMISHGHYDEALNAFNGLFQHSDHSFYKAKHAACLSFAGLHIESAEQYFSIQDYELAAKEYNIFLEAHKKLPMKKKIEILEQIN